jgi:hypothetical protein
MRTGNATLCERSTRHDTEWGGWDQRTNRYTGRNLLGVGLMHCRADLREGVLERFVERGFKRPFLFPMPDPGT